VIYEEQAVAVVEELAELGLCRGKQLPVAEAVVVAQRVEWEPFVLMQLAAAVEEEEHAFLFGPWWLLTKINNQ
jgi:hypothetical protein